MKNSFLILLIFLVPIVHAQQWITLDTTDLGLDIMSTRYVEIDMTDNSVWFGGLYRLHHLVEGTVDTDIYYWSDSGPANLATVNALAVEGGIVWGLDDMEGLFKYEGGTFTIMSSIMKEGYTITPDGQDSLWVGTSAFYGYGFFGYFNGNYDLYTSTTPGIVYNNVYHILEDSQNRKWITYWTPSAEGGAGYSLGKNNVWNYFHVSNTSIPTQHVKKMVESPTDTIWAATKYGLCRFDETLEDWVVYNQQNTNMPGEWIEDIQFDSQGRMWALFKDTALAYTYNYVDWTIFNDVNSPIVTDEMYTFSIDGLDQIWVGCLYKLHVLTLSSFTNWLATEEIENSEIDSKINIYPNPANEIITISGILENSEIEILNMQGKIVFKNQSTNSKTTIDVSEFERGIYIVRINNNQRIFVEKVIIK